MSVGSVAERSKALVLGTSPKGRGFESHRCQKFYGEAFYHKCYLIQIKAMLVNNVTAMY